MPDQANPSWGARMNEPQPAPETPAKQPWVSKHVRLPRLSGKASAAWLVVCFMLTAVLIPMTLNLPQWIKFEIVLAAWWVIWFAVLTRLLFTGQRVTDDYQLHEPRHWFGSGATKESKKRTSSGGGWWWWGPGGWVDPEGVLIVIAIIVALVVLFGLIWFLFEIGIPVILFLLYFVTRGMLARVINDRHHSRQRLRRSLAWGFLWATVYTAPLAAAVWLVHAVRAHRSEPQGVAAHSTGIHGSADLRFNLPKNNARHKLFLDACDNYGSIEYQHIFSLPVEDRSWPSWRVPIAGQS